MQYALSAIFGAVALASSGKLIFGVTDHAIALVTMTTVSFLCLLLVFFANQVDWFDLKNLKVKLRKIEETRAEIQKREDRIRQMAGIVGDLVTYLDATSMSAVSIDGSEDWVRQKLQTLTDLSGKPIDNPFSRMLQRLSERKDGDEKQLLEILDQVPMELKEDTQKK